MECHVNLLGRKFSMGLQYCFTIIHNRDRYIHQPLTCRPPNSDKLGDLVTITRVNIKILTFKYCSNLTP